MRLEINYKKKNVKNTNTLSLNNMILNKHGSLKKSKSKFKNA